MFGPVELGDQQPGNGRCLLGPISPLTRLDFDELPQQLITCFEEPVDDLALSRQTQPALALASGGDSVVGYIMHPGVAARMKGGGKGKGK